MPSQRELAARLGLTQAAVSMALRGTGRIAPATRTRVLAAARELGWRADPALAALTRRRWDSGCGPIAFLGSQVQRDDPRFDRYWLALRDAARSQGLRLHHIDHRLRRDAAGLAAELARLGVTRGVVVGQDTSGQEPWRLDWDRFAVVHCGLYAAPGRGDIVCADLLAAPAEAVARLASRGRIAAILTITPRSLSEQMLSAALHELADRDAIALWTGPPGALDAAVRWLAGRSAAQVLGYGDGMAEHLRRRGVRLPVASLAISEDRAQSGCCIPYTAVARRTLEVLLGKIAAGDHGEAAGGDRRIHLVPMPWREAGPVLSGGARSARPGSRSR